MELKVEVVYALAEGAEVVALRLPAGATLGDAVAASGIVERHPELSRLALKLGVYGQVRALAATAADGDRIEIYRPLVADPKASRQARVAKRRAERGDDRKMGA